MDAKVKDSLQGKLTVNGELQAGGRVPWLYSDYDIGYNENNGGMTDGRKESGQQTNDAGGNRVLSELVSRDGQADDTGRIQGGIYSGANSGLRIIAEQRSALADAGVPDLGFNATDDPAGFISALDEARASNRYGAAADDKTEQDLEGAVTLMSADGSAVAAGKPNRNITAVAENTSKTETKNAGGTAPPEPPLYPGEAALLSSGGGAAPCPRGSPACSGAWPSTENECEAEEILHHPIQR